MHDFSWYTIPYHKPITGTTITTFSFLLFLLHHYHWHWKKEPINNWHHSNLCKTNNDCANTETKKCHWSNIYITANISTTIISDKFSKELRMGLFSSELEIGLSLSKPGVSTTYELGLNQYSCETTLKTLETKSRYSNI